MARTTTTKKQAPVKQKTVGVIAVDNGGENTKVFSESMTEPISFGSMKAIGNVRHKKDPILPDELHSHLIEWNGQIYLTNYRAMQSRARKSSLKNTKTDDYFILSLLMAVAKFGYDENYVSTCVPYSRMTDEEIDGITDRLVGDHTLIIDEKTYQFTIADVLITGETMIGDYALKPTGGKTRLLDIGSRTVGYASVYRDDVFEQPLQEESYTIEREGLEARRDVQDTGEYDEYAENLSFELDHVFEKDDRIIVFGGGALIPEIIEAIAKIYPNIELAEDPLFVQVKGLLAFGLEMFTEEEDGELDG